MVRYFFPQSAKSSITANTNYPPQSGVIGGGVLTLDDEDFLLGAIRDSTEFLLGGDRDSVDFEMML